MYDHRLSGFSALVIDDSDMARSVLAGVLREAGLRSVTAVRDPRQARKLLEQEPFDVILCDYYYEQSDETGQDLLNDLRRRRALPFRTIFYMVTGEARYERVAEVVEHAPDDYLLKPFTAVTLIERLKATIKRKAALLTLHDHLERGRQDEALAAGEALIAANSPYRLSAAKICAEICLARNDHERANALYGMVAQSRDLPWARLGLAQVAYARNDHHEARRALESLISEHGRYADAYDLLGRIQMESADLPAALDTYRRAVEATPANLGRLQKLGTLACMLGEAKLAEQSLDKAMRQGLNAREFDFQSIVSLALLKLDRGAIGRDLDRLRSPLAQALARSPESFRLRALDATAQACLLLARREPDEATAQVRSIAGWVREAGFDFEMACNLLALVLRLERRRIAPPESTEWVAAIARRFTVSRTATDLLIACVREAPELAEIIRREHGTITALANEAMSAVVQGNVSKAMRRLVETGRETLNARLLSLATGLAARHAERITEAARDAVEEAEALRAEFCSYGTHAAVGPLASAARSEARTAALTGT